jgi:hypothetical protein
VRFSYAEAMCDPSFYLPVAMAAEEAGYHGFIVPDNLGPSKGKYPYREDGDNAFLEGEPFEVHVISFDAYSIDGIRRLEDEGVIAIV